MFADHPELSCECYRTWAPRGQTPVLQYPDGKTEDITEKAGVVSRFDAFTHPENTSKKRFDAIAVELKS